LSGAPHIAAVGYKNGYKRSRRAQYPTRVHHGMANRDGEWSWDWFAVGAIVAVAWVVVRTLWRTRLLIPLVAAVLWFPVLLGHGPNRLLAAVVLGVIFWMSVG